MAGLMIPNCDLICVIKAITAVMCLAPFKLLKAGAGDMKAHMMITNWDLIRLIRLQTPIQLNCDLCDLIKEQPHQRMSGRQFILNPWIQPRCASREDSPGCGSETKWKHYRL
jgi:hypothetical protein